MFKKISLLIIILLLLGSNIYLYTKIEKLDYDILIGTPVKSEDGSIGSNFLNSKSISNKDDFNTLIFYLMDARSIEKPNVCENLPNSIITFNDWKDGIQYYSINIWINENSLIIGTVGEQSSYKIIENNRAAEILNIIEKYK